MIGSKFCVFRYSDVITCGLDGRNTLSCLWLENSMVLVVPILWLYCSAGETCYLILHAGKWFSLSIFIIWSATSIEKAKSGYLISLWPENGQFSCHLHSVPNISQNLAKFFLLWEWFPHLTPAYLLCANLHYLQLKVLNVIFLFYFIFLFQDAARYRDELRLVAPHSLLKCSSDATTLVRLRENSRMCGS